MMCAPSGGGMVARRRLVSGWRSRPSARPEEQEVAASAVAVVCWAAGVAGLVALAVAAVASTDPWADVALVVFFIAVLFSLQVRPLRLWHQRNIEQLQLEESLFVPM